MLKERWIPNVPRVSSINLFLNLLSRSVWNIFTLLRFTFTFAKAWVIRCASLFLPTRQFSNQIEYNVVVSDLTYVRVGMSWNYICVLVDLFNREIIGWRFTIFAIFDSLHLSTWGLYWTTDSLTLSLPVS